MVEAKALPWILVSLNGEKSKANCRYPPTDVGDFVRGVSFLEDLGVLENDLWVGRNLTLISGAFCTMMMEWSR